MYLLLAHDYAKFWKAENKAVEVRRFEFAGEENERLYRRYVLRGLQNKKKVEEVRPRFILKRFQNIPSKVRQYMHPRGVVKREIEATKKAAIEKNKPDDACPKLSRSRDSAEIVRKKLIKHSSDEQHVEFDLENVSLCSDVIECTSELELVSRSSEHQDLFNLKAQFSTADNPKRRHLHLLCDGPGVRVETMPSDRHGHLCKLVAHCH